MPQVHFCQQYVPMARAKKERSQTAPFLVDLVVLEKVLQKFVRRRFYNFENVLEEEILSNAHDTNELS